MKAIDAATQQSFEHLAESVGTTTSEALSRLLHHAVTIETTDRTILPPSEIGTKFGKADALVTVVVLEVSDGLTGYVLLVFSRQDGETLASHLVQSLHGPADTHNESLEDSAIKEVGNIICGALLTEVSKGAKVKLVQSIPALATDMLQAVLDGLAVDISRRTSQAFACSFRFTVNPLSVSGLFALLIDQESLEKLQHRDQ